MSQKSVALLATVLGALSSCGALSGCAAPAGAVPMAGRRDASTTCVFGLRGVRVALEDEAPQAIDVRLTMCSDLPALRQRTRDFLAREGSAENASNAQNGVWDIQLGHVHAAASVEDIRGGVRIRVVPHAASDIESIREEIETRIARISTDNHCD